MTSEMKLPRRAPSGCIHPIVYVQAPLRWEDKALIRNVAEKPAPPEEELETLGAAGWEVAGIYTDAPLVDMEWILI